VADRTLELTKEIEVREEREIALKISEERFKGFADVAADRYWESDANHNIIYAPSVSKIVRELNVTILGKLA
jgi:PAS domain-containing protein